MWITTSTFTIYFSINLSLNIWRDWWDVLIIISYFIITFQNEHSCCEVKGEAINRNGNYGHTFWKYKTSTWENLVSRLLYCVSVPEFSSFAGTSRRRNWERRWYLRQTQLRSRWRDIREYEIFLCPASWRPNLVFLCQCHFNLSHPLFGDPTLPEQQVTAKKLKVIEFHSTCCEDKVLSPQLRFFCI